MNMNIEITSIYSLFNVQCKNETLEMNFAYDTIHRIEKDCLPSFFCSPNIDDCRPENT